MGQFDLETRDYDDADRKPENVTVIIFIRHGTSCANLRKKTSAKLKFYDRFNILDPGLTRKGIYDARKHGVTFREQLIRNYGMIIPTVYASVLLRTQMTAYLMMNPDLNKPYTINILAYISEEGNRLQDDNKPRNFEDQTKMLKKLDPIFNEIKREGYTQYKEKDHPDKLKPNFPMFIEELKVLCKKNEEKQLTSVPVPTTRCSVKNKMVNISERDTRTNYAPIVIVTHGHVLEKFLDKMGYPIDKTERPNFAAFRVYFNHKDGYFIKNPIDINYKPDTLKEKAKALFSSKLLPYFYPYDNTLEDDFDTTKECEYESQYQACEKDICDPNANASSTEDLGIVSAGGRRTRKRMRRKSRKRTQKNS